MTDDSIQFGLTWAKGRAGRGGGPGGGQTRHWFVMDGDMSMSANRNS